MLPDTNHISNRTFKIRNFEEDKIATLAANSGLRYDGKTNDSHRFSGNFYLKDQADNLIESFGIIIILPKSYPNVFPIVLSTDDKIEKNDDYHIDVNGVICVEHTYFANKLASASLRLYDFVKYYLPKYFSWVLLKQNGHAENLKEWEHQDKGTIQVYEEILNSFDQKFIKFFLENYVRAYKIRRNDKCYCGSNKKLKNCHLEVAIFLKATSKKTIEKDILLLS